MIDRRTLLAASPALATLPSLAKASSGLPLFDAHACLVSDDLANYPRPVDGRSRPDEAPARAEAVLAWMTAAGVEGGACVQHRAAYGYDNSYLLASSDAHRRRLAPVVVLDAQDPATPGRLHDWTRAHGLAGVRLTGPLAEDYCELWLDSGAALRTWAAADALGLLVELDGAAAPADRIAALAGRFRKCQVVVAADVGRPTPGNVFVKVTTADLARMGEPAADLRRLADRVGAERICWGSDIGNSAGTYAQMVARVLQATALLTPAERRMVLGETGRRLYRRRRA